MSKQKTLPTEADVEEYLANLPSESKRKEGLVILDMMKRITQLSPQMWGPTIIGFGSYHYKYESGHEGQAPLIAFSPRKARHVLYVLNNFEKRDELLAKLGKYKTGKVCLYINKLADVDMDVLNQIVEASWATTSKKYG